MGAEGDVLLGGTRSFLWRHGDFVGVVYDLDISQSESPSLQSDFRISVWDAKFANPGIFLVFIRKAVSFLLFC